MQGLALAGKTARADLAPCVTGASAA